MNQPNLSRLAQLKMYEAELKKQFLAAKWKKDQAAMDEIAKEFIHIQGMIHTEEGRPVYEDNTDEILLYLLLMIAVAVVVSLSTMYVMLRFIEWMHP